MDPTYVPRSVPCMLVLLLMFFSTFCNADLNKDREKCANQLVGLEGCLPYVGGDAKSPTIDCCSGLKGVLQHSRECLCILVKDRNDPNLGLKINATLALSLPDKCHAPANVSECPALLHLAPNSPDAKVFEDFAKNGNGSATAEAGGSSSTDKGSTGAAIKSDGGKGIRRLRIEMVLGLLIIVVLDVILPNF
ncbi:unnamed protein product [Coffea canephora]|uniref:Bifunctional inhibitor/plant lipid transfer protein/seed storage helical domain-containing protein n=1 Tax=Coffea canephora TaxID=49390 RepID=A0A068V9Z1_COFCA|nr:unnamed protein product [Coffea canephora]